MTRSNAGQRRDESISVPVTRPDTLPDTTHHCGSSRVSAGLVAVASCQARGSHCMMTMMMEDGDDDEDDDDDNGDDGGDDDDDDDHDHDYDDDDDDDDDDKSSNSFL
ncbi:hypothetical protein ElyMa_001582200 [Elysia marginata]|uniref:Uncharacterized protein n=1 Tax=Elysia marginata TaxID=1093978 RepID=A0AAV4JHE6_9GAST|nr:hypothetical protein ElyMa_001582200 [Elysia marginata]